MEAAVLALFFELCVGCPGFTETTYQIKAPFTQLDLLVPTVDPLDCSRLFNPAALQQSSRAELQPLGARAGGPSRAPVHGQ